MKMTEISVLFKKQRSLIATSAILLSVMVCGANAEESIEVVRSGIPHDSLYDVAINGEIGFAVGNAGLLIETKDAGATWTQLERMGNQAFLAIASKGDRTLIAGQKGTIMSKTGDGAWETVETPFETRLMKIDFNASGLVVAVGEFGLIHRSKDGGSSWDTIIIDWMQYNDEGYEPHLYDVTVRDDNNVVVVGEFGLILWSEDGGDSFIARHKGDESIFALHLDSEGTGTSFAVGQDNLIIRSQDGGQTWQKMKVPGEDSNLLAVWSGQGEVVITGIRTLLRSSDDGETWAKSEDIQVVRTWYQGLTTGVAEVSAGNGFLRSQAVYAVGQQARISRVTK